MSNDKRPISKDKTVEKYEELEKKQIRTRPAPVGTKPADKAKDK